MEPSDAIDAESFWQGQVADWQASGLTQKAYCEEQGLRYTAFGYWGPQAASGSRTLTREKAHLLRAGGSGYGYRPELGPAQRPGDPGDRFRESAAGETAAGGALMNYRLRPHPQMPRIYLYREPVDFRKSYRGLAAIVEQELGHNPFEGVLYAFTNRRRDKIKLLYWEDNGFVLYYKTLAEEKFHWPKGKDEVLTLNGQQINWLARRV